MRRGAPAVLAAGLAAAALLPGCPAPRPLLRPSPPASSTAAPRPPGGLIEARPGAARPQHPLPVPLAPSEYHEEPDVVGVVHVVRPGETIYRLARAYGVDPADLLEVNGIADPRQVAVGTELFVPGASRVVGQGEAGATGPAPATPLAPSPSATPGPSPVGAVVPGAASGRARLGWPLKGVLYGRYGLRSGHRHDGIDIAAPEGSAIGAAADGQVIYAGEQSGYGSIVILRHDDGLVTLYAHCSELLVDEGARVRRGEAVARVGQTGRTTGPHLHFEVREGTRPRNPLLFLP